MIYVTELDSKDDEVDDYISQGKKYSVWST